MTSEHVTKYKSKIVKQIPEVNCVDNGLKHFTCLFCFSTFLLLGHWLHNFTFYFFTVGSLAPKNTSLRFHFWANGSNIAVVLHLLTNLSLGMTEVDPNRVDSRFPGKVWPKAFRLSSDMRLSLLLSAKPQKGTLHIPVNSEGR